MRGWATTVILLLSTAARASTYVVHAPDATRIEAPAVTRLGAWEATVSFDPDVCEISCVYRLRADRFGRVGLGAFLLPPAVPILVFSGGPRRANIVVIDPAGLRLPILARRHHLKPERTVLPAEGPSFAPMAGSLESVTDTRDARPVSSPDSPRRCPASLRI